MPPCRREINFVSTTSGAIKPRTTPTKIAAIMLSPKKLPATIAATGSNIFVAAKISTCSAFRNPASVRR